MKIENSSFAPVTAGLPPRTAAAPPAPRTTSAQEAVSLSQSTGLHEIGTAPVNTARIAEIKQAISDGRFKINPEAIAERLIESARDLVNNKRET